MRRVDSLEVVVASGRIPAINPESFRGQPSTLNYQLVIKRIVLLSFLVALLGSGQAAPVYPVKYGPNSRYLVDQNDTPFPIMGRTAWFITSLSVADYRTFVDDTAARGYSAIEISVITHDPRGNNPPFGGNGALPFLNRLNGTSWNGALTYGNINNEAPNFTTPNEAYWSAVDGLLAYCESKGILVFMFPAYVGYAGGDQGWMQEMVANGTNRMQIYGAWIATRYKDQKNLVWMMGGDMGTGSNPFNTAQTSVENALLTGLKSVAGQQSVLFSAEWNQQSISTDQVTFGSSMTLNGAYSWTGDVNSHGRRAYAYSPVEPAFLLEGPYDEEGPDGNAGNPSAIQPVRRFQWWGWLSTIGGYISGNGYIIRFRTNDATVDWRNHLDTQGTRDMTRLNNFMGSIAWYNLVPSGLNGMRTLVTAGGSTVSSSSYVSAAATPDGTLMVAYIPPAHTGPITVDMAALSGPARARWFDPTSAAYTDIGTGLTNTGTRVFTIPGNNSAGAADWVLVLDHSTGSAAPTISDIADQSTPLNTPTPAIPFTIGDTDTAVGSLTLSGGSSNPTLVPTNSIVFGGSGANRTVTVTPAAGLSGIATITATVSDGTSSASDTFVLTVGTLSTATKSFTNSAAITIPDQGAATPYPSPINVTNLGGTITNVTVTLRGLTHSWASDVDVLLAGPGGQAMLLMSDCGDGPMNNANNVTLTLADGAGTSIPASGVLGSGTFRPTDFALGSADTFPGPAPAGPYGTTFSIFTGLGANGVWSLYVFDDGPGDLGSFAGGWSITITTVTAASSNTVPTISAITNQITTVNTPETGVAFTIGDAQTAASNLVLTATSANTTLVPTNNITFGGSGANRTVTITPASNQIGSATITLIVSDGTLSASNSFVQSVNPASLIITENSTNRIYGVTNPVLTGSITGLQAGDNITASFLSSAATTNSPVGAYPISFTLADPGSRLGNYSLTTNNGTLTVSAANLLITAAGTNKVYGATLNPTEFMTTGLLNSDTVTNVSLSSAGSGTNAPVGSYAINAASALGIGLTNYSIGYSNGTLSVAQAPLTATADDKSRAYGQPNPAFTISITGFVNGEGTNVLNGLPLASTTATSTTAPGNIPITLAGGSDDNYSFSLVPGALSISPPGVITITTVEMLDADHLRLTGTGDADVSYLVQASADLQTWQTLGTATADGTGAFEFVDALAGGFTARFYRVATP